MDEAGTPFGLTVAGETDVPRRVPVGHRESMRH
jgi:hypothetical protein